MKIIILGANQVGSALAETLANEANDITVVDADTEKLRELKDHIDIGTVLYLMSWRKQGVMMPT
jgi:trk system potassium uptake protein TrkA